jgi:hypothetical protein
MAKVWSHSAVLFGAWFYGVATVVFFTLCVHLGSFVTAIFAGIGFFAVTFVLIWFLCHVLLVAQAPPSSHLVDVLRPYF